MGVDLPLHSMTSILQEQLEWEKKHQHKGYIIIYIALFRHWHKYYFQQEPPPEEGQEGSPRAGEVLHGDSAWTGECCGRNEYNG